jgi:hypothetical protein
MKFDDWRVQEGKIYFNGRLYAEETPQSSIDAQDARHAMENGQRRAHARGRQEAEEEVRAIYEPNLDDLD